VGFFIRASGGKELLASHFVAFRGDGTAPTWPGAFFDDARNWALVSSMIGDPGAHVTHVFVAAPLRARLLSYAERVGAPIAVRVHAAEVMQQPRGALPHDDHFHVRIGCPAHMGGCIENPAAPNARPRRLELMAHGRRGGAPRTVVATATSTTTTTSSATPTPTVAHDRTPDPTDNAIPSPDPVEPAPAPEAPPASIAVPVDDVDG
jgi:penicillin-insensitive murein endopeptidase